MITLLHHKKEAKSWSYRIILTWYYWGNSDCPAHICCPGLVGIRLPIWEGPDPICH